MLNIDKLEGEGWVLEPIGAGLYTLRTEGSELNKDRVTMCQGHYSKSQGRWFVGSYSIAASTELAEIFCQINEQVRMLP